MANEVFANGLEISCKKADGLTRVAFPDVCMTPPITAVSPLGIPIPYPNTGLARDTSGGTRSIKISGHEVMIRNVSYFKTSYGDEAGCATSAKKGIITGTIKGKVYFKKWSMNVKYESKNVVRHTDLTTHNHASEIGNESIPWLHVDTGSFLNDPNCKTNREAIEHHCKPLKNWEKNCPTPPKQPKHPGENASAAKLARYKKNYEKYLAKFPAFAKKCNDNACLRARKCMLVPYQPKSGCCPGQTGDHVIDAASFLEPPSTPKQSRNSRKKIPGWKKYNVDKAPCICAEGPNQTTATHGQLHVRRGVVAERQANGTWSSKKAAQVGAKAITKVFPDSGCNQACLEAQINQYHDSVANPKNPSKPIKAQASMTSDPAERAKARKEMLPKIAE